MPFNNIEMRMVAKQIDGKKDKVCQELNNTKDNRNINIVDSNEENNTNSNKSISYLIS